MPVLEKRTYKNIIVISNISLHYMCILHKPTTVQGRQGMEEVDFFYINYLTIRPDMESLSCGYGITILWIWNHYQTGYGITILRIWNHYSADALSSPWLYTVTYCCWGASEWGAFPLLYWSCTHPSLHTENLHRFSNCIPVLLWS